MTNGTSSIATRHKSQKQLPDILSSPGITRRYSLLLGLPVETLLEIIELLEDDWQATTKGRRKTHPLKSLRLTCKQLEDLCNPIFAQTVVVDPMDLLLVLRKELAPKFARYLRTIEVDIWDGEVEGEFLDSVCATILEHAINLRQLTLRHSSIDNKTHTRLLNAISKLSALECVTIVELEWSNPRPYYAVPTTFHHRLLHDILDHHSQRLRELMVYSRTPMHESTFVKLRDTASQLRRLELIRSLTTETRDAFTDPRMWACAGRLEHIYFRECSIHPATIARHLGAGVFGPLRSLHLITCGDESGDPTESTAPIWTIPPLEVVGIEHFSDREMDKLKSIHTKKVYVTRAWSDRKPCIEAFGKSTTFPEAVELHVARSWNEKDFAELERSCGMRGLMKVERDHTPMATCSCHDE